MQSVTCPHCQHQFIVQTPPRQLTARPKKHAAKPQPIVVPATCPKCSAPFQVIK